MKSGALDRVRVDPTGIPGTEEGWVLGSCCSCGRSGRGCGRCRGGGSCGQGCAHRRAVDIEGPITELKLGVEVEVIGADAVKGLPT